MDSNDHIIKDFIALKKQVGTRFVCYLHHFVLSIIPVVDWKWIRVLSQCVWYFYWWCTISTFFWHFRLIINIHTIREAIYLFLRSYICIGNHLPVLLALIETMFTIICIFLRWWETRHKSNKEARNCIDIKYASRRIRYIQRTHNWNSNPILGTNKLA